MKKKIATIVSMIMIMTLVLGLAACGSSNIVGSWEATGYKIDDEIKTFEDVGLGGLEITMEFTDDGKLSVVNNGQEAEGTWEKKDDDKVTVTLAGSPQEMLIEDGKLLMGTEEVGYVVLEEKK